MIPWLLAKPASLLLGTLYPAYASYKAVKTKDVREYVKWMMYWIVFAAFTVFEAVADVVLAFWFPFYYELKILLLLWLITPVSRGSLGSSILYRKVVHPNILKREERIDRLVSKAQEQSYIAVVRLGRNAMEYLTNLVMTTAVQAPALMANLVAITHNAPIPDAVDGARFPVADDRRRLVRVEHQTLQQAMASSSSSNTTASIDEEEYESFRDEDSEMLSRSTSEMMSPDAENLISMSSDDENDAPRPGTSRQDDAVFAAPSPVRESTAKKSAAPSKAMLELSSDSEMEVDSKPVVAKRGRAAKTRAQEALSSSPPDDETEDEDVAAAVAAAVAVAAAAAVAAPKGRGRGRGKSRGARGGGSRGARKKAV